MRLLVQRVAGFGCREGACIGSIEHGLLVFVEWGYYI